MSLKSILTRSSLALIALSAHLLAFSADPKALDPKEALNDWLSNHDARSYFQCLRGANTQSQVLLETNPQIDPSDFATASHLFMLKCLYGINLVNQSLCLGQPKACQPVTLLIPTMDQLHQSQSPQEPGDKNYLTNFLKGG
jgi:hypothetical protein